MARDGHSAFNMVRVYPTLTGSSSSDDDDSRPTIEESADQPSPAPLASDIKSNVTSGAMVMECKG